MSRSFPGVAVARPLAVPMAARKTFAREFVYEKCLSLIALQLVAITGVYYGAAFYVDGQDTLPIEARSGILWFILVAIMLSSGLVLFAAISRPRFSDTRTTYDEIETGLESVDRDPRASLSAQSKRTCILEPWRFHPGIRSKSRNTNHPEDEPSWRRQ